MSATVRVSAASRAYDVVIEEGGLARLGDHVRKVSVHDRAVLIVDRAVELTHGATAAEAMQSAGFAVSMIGVEATEEKKSPHVVTDLHLAMAANRVERSTPVVAVGGGITGDVTGFAAATYLRGVPVIQCPTTLLSMVDASVGGKTGVNLKMPDGSLAKNLIGAFWQPSLVMIDPRSLTTLASRHVACGLAECIKHGMIADATLLAFLEESMAKILSLDGAALSTLVARNVEIKAGVVRIDEREESDVRALLDLGHTFGHAIESQRELGLLHGEAVAVGIAAACDVSVTLGRMTDPQRIRVLALLRSAALPVALPKSISPRVLLDSMLRDKKVKDGRVRLVLPRGLGAAELVDGVDGAVVQQALAAIGARG